MNGFPYALLQNSTFAALNSELITVIANGNRSVSLVPQSTAVLQDNMSVFDSVSLKKG